MSPFLEKPFVSPEGLLRSGCSQSRSWSVPSRISMKIQDVPSVPCPTRAHVYMTCANVFPI